MTSRPLEIAVVGATGAVGQELLCILSGRKFPIRGARLFASEKSRGRKISFLSKENSCEVLSSGCFEGVDLAFFDVSEELSEKWVPEAARSAWVIDSSSTFRMDSDKPLIVPEVNGSVLESSLPASKILTGPNCSIAQLVLPLKALHDRFRLKRVIVSTYQSASGAGAKAVMELKEQTQRMIEGETAEANEFPHPLSFNCIPQIGRFDEAGFSSEESKMIAESRKILGIPDLAITVTAVRVPTISCHAESVNLEFEKPFELEEARAALKEFPGVRYVDDPEQSLYPMGIQASGQDDVFVGRLRRDPSVSNGLHLWVVADNLRKGAALNAVQIAELLLQKDAFS